TAWERHKSYIIGAAAIVLAQTLLIAALLIQRSRRRQAEAGLSRSQAELRSSYERIRDLGGRLLGAQEAERSRVAPELHDDISPQLAVLTIDLERLNAFARSRDRTAADLARRAVDRAQGIARSLHDVSYRLHPAKLHLVGLVPAITSLQRTSSQPGVT